MCLGEPARVRSIDGTNAAVETLDGVIEVSLVVLAAQHRAVHPGDWVVVSIGLAIDVLDAAEALELTGRLAELRGWETAPTPEMLP